MPASLARPAPQVKQRLFAYPSRAASLAAGGAIQLRSERASQQIQNFQNYFSGVLHLAKNQYTLRPLRQGSVVVAGTILGRIGQGSKKRASHLEFMIRPAGGKAPYIDPKPILDGWGLLQATSIYSRWCSWRERPCRDENRVWSPGEVVRSWCGGGRFTV